MLDRVPAEVLLCIVQWLRWRNVRALRCVNRRMDRTLRDTEHRVPRRLAATELEAQLALGERVYIAQHAPFLLEMLRPGEPLHCVAADQWSQQLHDVVPQQQNTPAQLDVAYIVSVAPDGCFTLNLSHSADTAVALLLGADGTLQSLGVSFAGSEPQCVFVRSSAQQQQHAPVSLLGWPARTRYYDELPLVALCYTSVVLHGRVWPLPLQNKARLVVRTRQYSQARRTALTRTCRFLVLRRATDARIVLCRVDGGCVTDMILLPHDAAPVASLASVRNIIF